MRVVSLAMMLLLSVSAGSQNQTQLEAPPLSPVDLAGVWKLCYEPGLPGVQEASGAYLVLMPNLEYYEVREDCCRITDVELPNPGTTGRYSIEGRVVVQHCVSVSGKPYDRRLRFVPSAEVVTFDQRKGPVVQGPVLQIGSDLNYGYVKVFWRKNWLTP